MKAVLTDVMGDDLKIANAARASFGKKSDWTYSKVFFEGAGERIVKKLAEKDAKLIRFLARGMTAAEMEKLLDAIDEFHVDDPAEHRATMRNLLNYFRGKATHWVPFAHCHMTFEITMPIFTARQLIRHVIAVTVSEQSRRYVDEDPEYWQPENNGWRLRADNVKQGSSDAVLTGHQLDEWLVKIDAFHALATELYREAVDIYGIAPELARCHLPQDTYTDWTWTASLVTIARVCHQRLDAHAQKEIQVLTKPIYDAALEKFPVGFKALMDFGTENMEGWNV